MGGHENFNRCFTKKMEKKRKLTLLGRKCVVQTFVIAKITYLASVISITNQQLKQLERIIYEYKWDGKKDKVKRSTMIGSFEDGGIELRDLNSHIDMLRVKWIQKLLDKTEANWK